MSASELPDYLGRRVECFHCSGRGWGQHREAVSFFSLTDAVTTHDCETCAGRGWLPEEECEEDLLLDGFHIASLKDEA